MKHNVVVNNICLLALDGNLMFLLVVVEIENYN